jgi:hypothetical protein
MNDAERGGHHVRLAFPDQRGLHNVQAKDVIASALAHLWDDGCALIPDVKNDIYAPTDAAWTQCEATDNPPSQALQYTPRGTLPHAFELRDVYKPLFSPHDLTR